MPDAAVSAEAEPNNDGLHAQKITLPCDVAGSFFPAADVDVFEFEAKAGFEFTPARWQPNRVRLGRGGA